MKRRFLLQLLPLVSASTPCYHPNGTPAPPQWQPCNGDTLVGMCCAKGYGDQCRPADGLCLGIDEQIYRDSCFDPTWNSDRCLKLCLEQGVGNFNDTPITLCPDSSYCCGANNITCCTAKQGVFIVNNDGVFTILPTPPSTSTSSSTSSSYSSSTTPAAVPSPTSSFTTSTIPSSTTSSAPTPTQTIITDGGGGLSKAATIGTIVGSIAGVLTLVVAIIFGCNQWRHWGKERPVSQQLSPHIVVEELRFFRAWVAP